MIDAEHVEVIAETIGQIPTGPAQPTPRESTLTETARSADPRVVKRHGRILLARIDQGGQDPHQENKLAEPANELHLHTQANGWVKFRGIVDPEAGEVLVGLIGELSLPQSSTEGVPDPRPAERRRGDAFVQVFHSAAQIDQHTAGTTKPHLHLFLNYDALKNASPATPNSSPRFSTANRYRWTWARNTAS